MIKKSKFLIVLVIILFQITLRSQSFTGIWEGKIAGTLIVNLEIKEDSTNQLQTYLTIKSQNLENYKASQTEIVDDTLSIQFTEFNASYQGQIAGDTITGIWKQGQELVFNLHRVQQKYVQNRPQMPIEPYPYESKEFSFTNEALDIILQGTLSLPYGEGPFPTVILISGSGPTDRDATFFGHKIFLVISDYLTRQGMAVLRYDDRGVGKSEGIYSTATSEDLAKDTEAAFMALSKHPKIDKSNFGLIGHSEGGMIAPMIAAINPDVKFIVLLAGPGVSTDKLMVEQNSLSLGSMGLPEELLDSNEKFNTKLYEILNTGKPMSELYDRLLPLIHGYYGSLPADYQEFFGPSREAYYMALVGQLSSPWMRYFIAYDPEPALSKVQCRILALNGSKDLQVVADMNIDGINSILKKSKHSNYETKIFPDLNHLFQHADTGSVQEYGQIEETFSEEVLEYITKWILKNN